MTNSIRNIILILISFCSGCLQVSLAQTQSVTPQFRAPNTLTGHLDPVIYNYTGKIGGPDSLVNLWYLRSVFATKTQLAGKADSTRLYTEQLPSVWNRKGIAIPNAQEASVIVDGNPQILTGAATVFKLWYTIGFGSSPTIGYAESLDGINFTSYSGSLGLSGAHSKVVKNGSTFYIYITINSGANIARYSSTNGILWTLDSSSVLPLGASGSWDDTNFGNTSVYIDGSTWRMIYEAKGTEFAVGTATSTDGLTWTKGGQILTTMFLGGPDLHKIGGVFYMWCHTTKLPSYGRRFKSTDFVTWTQDPANPTIIGLTSDEGAGSPLAQVCDLELAEYNGRVYQYYTANPNGSVSYSGGVQIKVSVANMPFATLVTTTEDAPRNMGIDGSSFTTGDDVKHRGRIGATAIPNYSSLDNGFYLTASGSTNLDAVISENGDGNGYLGLITKNVGLTTVFDSKPGGQNYVNNGNPFYYGPPGVAGNEVAKKSDITGLATVATTGSYSDLTGKPTIYSFTGSGAQYTKGNGTYAAFPTNVSSFTNDTGYEVASNKTATSSSSTTAYPNWLGVTNAINANNVTYPVNSGGETWQTVMQRGSVVTNINPTLLGSASDAVGSGIFQQWSNGLAGTSLRQQLLQFGTDGDLLNYSYNGSAYRLNYRISNSTGNITVGGNFTASSFIKSGGTSSQYLMADGSTTTLSGYSEGSWTPTASSSLSSATGHYTKNGKQVMAYFSLQVNTNSDATTFTISGLPFANNSTIPGAITIGRQAFSGGSFTGVVETGQTSFYFRFQNNTVLTGASASNGSINGVVIYYTD